MKNQAFLCFSLNVLLFTHTIPQDTCRLIEGGPLRKAPFSLHSRLSHLGPERNLAVCNLDLHRAAGTPVRVYRMNLLPCLFAVYLALHLSCTSSFLHFILLALHSSCTSPFLALHLSAFCFSWASPFYFFHLAVRALHLSAVHLSWASPLTSCT